MVVTESTLDNAFATTNICFPEMCSISMENWVMKSN